MKNRGSSKPDVVPTSNIWKCWPTNSTCAKPYAEDLSLDLDKAGSAEFGAGQI
ncbi:MAG: hypothetical protein J6Q15_02685 [Clostridia bacterium]|nr:hypothetical protein [Clostridia bacterium]